MTRLRFTRTLCGVLLLTGFVPSLAAALRETISLNEGWKFRRQAAAGAADEPEFSGAEKPAYQDSGWATVYLPHTWDATPDNPFTVPHHFRGIGWYRRVLEVPGEWKKRRVFVDFKGVFQVADVWVNGSHAGRHAGGYLGFRFDITRYLRPAGQNLLAVRVNDVLDPNIAPANETNVPGYGGIYRSVSMTATDPVQVSANGTLIGMEQSGDAVILRILSRVKNSDASAHTVHVRSEILDAESQSVAAFETTCSLTAGAEQEVSQVSKPIRGAHLWSPDSPYLYRLVSRLSYNGKDADEASTLFGVRFMTHDAGRGFVLNGKPINLHGANRRQDYGFLGDAVPESMGERDIRIIKDMGANFIRTSHYPQDPAVLAACDRLGILVWEEVPNIKIYLYPPSDDRTQPTETERFTRSYVANVKEQIREMIERDRNHPSIIIWGFADDLSLYHYPEDMVELSEYTHSLDTTRWTAGRAPHVIDIEDATTGNLLKRHQQHPEHRYIWNEWGSFASERGQEGAPFYKSLPADPGAHVSMGDSDAALLMEAYWMQWEALPWLGTLKWCMFDTGEVNAVQTQSLWTRDRDGKVTPR